MRLINCSTLQLEEFLDRNIPPYAILSHTWGDEEVSFADFRSLQPTTTTRSGYQKILSTCQQALRDELNYAWIDTACIDKSSSAELSEAINSMFTWYKNSAVCYAYLSDVSEANLNEEFPASRWFTRGWTLQELLAPDKVIFYDKRWHRLGSKHSHAEWISKITGIDTDAILAPRKIEDLSMGLGRFCVAKRMSWASARQTTRVEDMAYCLLGIFEINMPLLYGEGDRAFFRLQEEIIRKIDDDSILAWGLNTKMIHHLGLIPDTVKKAMGGVVVMSDILATSPKDFVNCANLGYAAHSVSPFTLTNVGLQIQLPLVPVFRSDDYAWIGLLSCTTGSSQEFLGILLCPWNRGDSRMSRTFVDKPGHSSHTFVVGSRAAARSELRNVTITALGYSDIRAVRMVRGGYRHIIINESRALKSTGYRVSSAIAYNTVDNDIDDDDIDDDDIVDDSPRAYSSGWDWDLTTKVLTMEGETKFRDMTKFCFETLSSRQDTKFTVFMRTISSKALVREGDYFSEDDRRNFYEYLEHESPQPDLGYVVIHDSEGGSFRVSVEVHATRVYDNRLFEVNVDAVQIAGGDG
jgi:hypothetical protein